MDAPSGLTFVDPSAIVKQLSIVSGSTVADFGCGSGYFSFEFARHVGAEGVVHALDVLPSALEAVASRAKTLGISNIITKRVNLEREQGSGLGAESVDWVVLKDMLFQNQKKDAILHEVARVLKPGGQALIMEWNPREAMVGPEQHLRISPERVKELAVSAGLTVGNDIEVGGFHYAFIAKK